MHITFSYLDQIKRGQKTYAQTIVPFPLLAHFQKILKNVFIISCIITLQKINC